MNKILVVSHERSGTHFLINTIAKNFGYDHNQLEIFAKDARDPSDEYRYKYHEQVSKHCRKLYGDNSRRIYKSHHQVEFFDLDSLNKHFYVFYVVRDVRDVLTSCYHYFHASGVSAFPKPKSVEHLAFSIKPYLYPFDAAYSHIKSEDFVSRWIRHVGGWVNSGVAIIRYENLKNKFDDALGHIGYILSQKPRGRYVPTLQDKAVAPRKGVIGDWKNHLSKKASRSICDRVRANGLGHLLQ